MFAKLNFVQFAIGQLALLVGSSGLEPPTSRLSGVRSNHLSYAPMFIRVSLKGSGFRFSSSTAHQITPMFWWR